jgi:hypothetical protein
MLNGQSKPQHRATSVHPLLRLQRSIGNRAVARLIQAKLRRSESSDVSKIARDALARRKATAHGAEVGTAPPIVNEVLASPGQRLDAATRAFFEPRFGHDFSSVRVHAGAAAAQSANEMSARAFTVGNNIVFGTGQLSPGTQDGRRLLAHELTHVIQQRTGIVARQIIQRAKIPYGPLTWADFKAQPPNNRNPAEGAGILSAFDIPGFAVSPDTKRKRKSCRIGSSRSKIYEAKLVIDAKAFDSLAPYMDQERSWALDRYKGDGTVYCEGRVGKNNARLFSQCLTDETAERARLLKHEQVHFDITNVMAGKAKASLSTEAAKIKLSATACGQEAASDAVLALYETPHKDLVDLGKKWQTSKDQAQDDFDTQTGHGAKIAEQNAWEGRIGTGLTDYDPTTLPPPTTPSTTAPAPTLTKPAPPPSRGYSCGGSSGFTGSCTECEKKKLMGQPLRTKLLINEPGDAYEQEADRVAARVMRMTETDSRPGDLRSVSSLRELEGQHRSSGATSQSRRDVPGQPVRGDLIQRQPKSDGPSLRDVPILLEKLELDVGNNLLDYGHHLYRAATLYPDDPDALKNALGRYALGANVLKDSYRFFGFKPDTAGKLAYGTGILFKGLTFLRQGELTLDFQVDVGRGVKFETNLNLGVNPKDLTDVRKAEVHFGLVRRF